MEKGWSTSRTAQGPERGLSISPAGMGPAQSPTEEGSDEKKERNVQTQGPRTLQKALGPKVGGMPAQSNSGHRCRRRGTTF